MVNKKSASVRSSKNKKRASGMSLLRRWNTSAGRAALILVILALVGIGVFITSRLSNQSSFIRTYNYKDGSAAFSFQYPADFNNTTKPAVLGGDSDGYVAQQAEKDPDGAIIGFVRAIYTPSTSGNSNLIYNLQQALQGSPADLQSFGKQLGESTYGDCSKSPQVIAAANDRKLVKCPLSSALGTEYKGDVLMGASSNGLYEFDYWIKAGYWDAHASAWSEMYQSLSYN